jgi:phenylacetate-coenzyme A ligase PaaK-like adenylate-forming protein
MDISGTTGEPQYIARDFSDIKYQTNDYVGLNSNDIVLNLFWAGMWGVYTTNNLILMKMGVKIVPYGGNNFNGNDAGKVEKIIRDLNINTIIGVPSTILSLGNFLKSSNKIRESIKKIFCLGEKMHKSTYSALMNAFPNAIIKTKYACMEATGIGYQCEYLKLNNYHIFDNRYVEVLDDSGKPVQDGEDGRIVVTTLDERLIPLIRYDTGDIGHFTTNDCECSNNRILTVLYRADKEIVLSSVHIDIDKVSDIVRANCKEYTAHQLIIRQADGLDELEICIDALHVDHTKILEKIYCVSFPPIIDPVYSS